MFIDMYKHKPILILFIFLCILLPTREIFAQPEDVKNSEEMGEGKRNHVIANAGLQNSELSLNQLRSIFSLRARKWPDGTPITVFVLRDENQIHREFLLKTLKMLPHQLRRQWDRYIYSGIGQGPVVVESQAEMISKVQSTPGGIGYMEGGVPDAQVHELSIL